MVEVLFSPESPIAGMRTFPEQTFNGRGWFTLLRNGRWDSGAFVVRKGTELYLSAPEPGMLLVDLFTPVLNGTYYLLGLFAKAGKVRVYYSTGGADWIEASGVGTWTGSTDGDSRFATNSGQFSVAVVKKPQHALGSVVPARDVAVIGNGADYNRIWDPDKPVDLTVSVTGTADNGSGLIRVTFGANHNLATGDTIYLYGVLGTTEANGHWVVTRINATTIDLQASAYVNAWVSGGQIDHHSRFMIHKPITIPADADLFSVKATFPYYWQVASSSGKTYHAAVGPPIVNDSVGTNRFDFSNTTVAPYTGGNTVIKWTWGTVVVATQIAAVYCAASPLDLNKGLVMILEDMQTLFGSRTMLANVKIEVNHEDVAYNLITEPWMTVYDPSSANEYLRRYDVVELANSSTSEDPILQWFFPTDHLDATNRSTIYHLRVVVLDDPAIPTVESSVTILAICGAGDFPGTTEIQMAYEDTYGLVETKRFVPSNSLTAILSEVGGPSVFSSDQAAFNLAISSAQFYGYIVSVKNSDGASSIEGGLDGQPSGIAYYARLPVDGGLEPDAIYMGSGSIYTPGYFAAPFIGKGWLKTSADSVANSTLSGTNLAFRDPSRKAPSDYQIAIPRARVLYSKNGRLFAADVLDDADQRQRGDGYFSGWRQPFRFQSISESETTGGRFVADGERVMGFMSSAAGAQGVSYVHVVTNKWLYPLGGSGSQGSNPLDSFTLGVMLPAIGRGTNAPRSICEKDGAIFYLDNTGQFVRMREGAVELSRQAVDNVLAEIPYDRVDSVSAAVYNSRVYVAYTEGGTPGDANGSILGWNDLMDRWEFNDEPPVEAERIVVYQDATLRGSGQRLLIATRNGDLYHYEYGHLEIDQTTMPFAIHAWTMVSSNPRQPIQIESVTIDADPTDNVWTLDRLLSSPEGWYRTSIDMSKGWATDKNSDHVKITPVEDNGNEYSRAVRLVVEGSAEPGTTIRMIAVNVIQSSARHATGT